MRVTNSTLASLVLFFGLANAQTAYQNTCNPPPTGEKDVGPGVVATYSCGKIHDKGEYAGDQRITATPEECAKECDKRVPEGPCSWHSGTCYFYSAGAGDAAWTEAVTIQTRKDWGKLKEAYDQCQTDKDACLTGGGGGGGGPPDGGPPSKVLPNDICEK